MTTAILITGVSGAGKSTVCAALEERGYQSFDMEAIDGLFTMIDTETGEPFADFDPNDLESIEKSEWICDTGQLQAHIQEQTAPIAFYGGIASNQEQLRPFFDDVVLLTASPAVLRERLSTRTTNRFGRAPDVQEQILGWKDDWEAAVLEEGAIAIDADRELSVVVTAILDAVGR